MTRRLLFVFPLALLITSVSAAESTNRLSFPAAGFSIAVFVLLTIPLWAIGFFALGQSGMTLATIKTKIRKLGARA